MTNKDRAEDLLMMANYLKTGIMPQDEYERVLNKMIKQCESLFTAALRPENNNGASRKREDRSITKSTSREMTEKEAKNLDAGYATKDFTRILDEIHLVSVAINSGNKEGALLHIESLTQEVTYTGLSHGANLDNYEPPNA